MSLSEFRYNKKRKHYAYLFKDIGLKRKNIILTSKPYRIYRKKLKKNVRLFKHPNPKIDMTVYVIPYVFIDDEKSFYNRSLKWTFHPNDKRKIKRIKKRIK